MSRAWIIGAVRTPVGNINGALSHLTAWELGQLAFETIITRLDLRRDDIGICLLGNALYGGGNPTRVSALAAGIPEAIPSWTIDSQCCSGIDAVSQAASLINSGTYDLILAGGTESHSTAPRRLSRGVNGAPDTEYSQPPFSPWPDRDPDMLDAAADLARDMKITRSEQEAFAVASHRHALTAQTQIATELLGGLPLQSDDFTRALNLKACARLPVIAGDAKHGLTAATTAVKSDASAVCAVVSDHFLNANPRYRRHALKVVAANSRGTDPAMPALAPIEAIAHLLELTDLKIRDIEIFEIMEAFAVQAIACIRAHGIDAGKVNIGGGALARGHPIGASGAINIVRLYHEMIQRNAGGYGLATIAGAGGLGSAFLLSR